MSILAPPTSAAEAIGAVPPRPGRDAARAPGEKDFAAALADAAAADKPRIGYRSTRPDHRGPQGEQRLRPGKADQPNGSVEVAEKNPDDYSLGDLLDVVNPLQHIPVVSTVYRALTGDTIRPEMRIAGGALFGGVVGMALATGDAMVEQATGRDVGGNLVAVVDPELAPITRRDAATATARAEPAPAPASAPVAAKTAEAKAPAAPQAAEASSARPWLDPDRTPAGGRAAGHPAVGSIPVAARMRTPVDGPTSVRADQPVPPMRPKQGEPQRLSAEAFDALMRGVGGTPDARAGALAAGGLPDPASVAALRQKAADAPPRPRPVAEGAPPQSQGSSRTVAASADEATTINGQRFYPVGRKSVPGPAPVPLMLPPEKLGYDQALVAMQKAMDKYQSNRAATRPPVGDDPAGGGGVDAKF